jgi:aminopeptidase N
MENTTAVIHGEFVYSDEREFLDDPNEMIIAHELFHHWFGDWVTCE